MTDTVMAYAAELMGLTAETWKGSALADIVEDVLSFDTSTEVFASLDSPTRGLTVSSSSQILFSMKENLKVGPRAQLYYNTLVRHVSYLFDISLVLDITLW